MQSKTLAQVTEDVKKKSAELENSLGCKVHPLVFQVDEDGEYIVGFLRHPKRVVQMRVLDKSLLSPMTAAEEMLEVCLIKEESDKRIYSEESQYDSIYIGACMAASKIIKFAQQQFKKN